MSNKPIEPDPSRERLAAYLDGRLGGAEAARVEAWLSDNPAAADEIEGQRRLLRLWQNNPPPEPNPAAWAAALSRIDARLPTAARRPPRVPRPLWFAAAAAVVAGVFLLRSSQDIVAPKTADEALPVIAPGDVTVISIDARDAAGLVVAASPVPEPILLAGQEDVSILDLKSYRDDDPAPHVAEGQVPMVVAASAAGAPRGP